MLWWWRARYALRATAKRAFWRNRSNRRAVPLSKIQTDVLRLLASHRDPESYVAGATPLNRDAPRYSGDIDVFHDREERVAAAALDDAKVMLATFRRKNEGLSRVFSLLAGPPFIWPIQVAMPADQVKRFATDRKSVV